MNTTSPSPPGFVWIGSINQLLVTQTLPDGSMDTPRVSHQSVAVVAVRRNRLTGLISGRVVFRLRVAKFGDPLPAEGSDPDVIVSVDRDAPGDHDSPPLYGCVPTGFPSELSSVTDAWSRSGARSP